MTTEKLNVCNSENFDEANINSLKEAKIPAKTYTMLERKNSSKVKIKRVSECAMKKTVKMILAD